jgi:hypothetical protein
LPQQRGRIKGYQANEKKLHDYLRLSTTEAFLNELSNDEGIPASTKNALIEIRKGGNKNNQGTWGHPLVAIHCGQWCSPKFAVLVSKWVFKWMLTGRNPASTQPGISVPEFRSSLEELEQLAISLRFQTRTLHTGVYQPMDQPLVKSLHTILDS